MARIHANLSGRGEGYLGKFYVERVRRQHPARRPDCSVWSSPRGLVSWLSRRTRLVNIRQGSAAPCNIPSLTRPRHRILLRPALTDPNSVLSGVCVAKILSSVVLSAALATDTSNASSPQTRAFRAELLPRSTGKRSGWRPIAQSRAYFRRPARFSLFDS